MDGEQPLSRIDAKTGIAWVLGAALAHVEKDEILGVGTGSTANFFIDALASLSKPTSRTITRSRSCA